MFFLLDPILEIFLLYFKKSFIISWIECFFSSIRYWKYFCFILKKSFIISWIECFSIWSAAKYVRHCPLITLACRGTDLVGQQKRTPYFVKMTTRVLSSSKIAKNMLPDIQIQRDDFFTLLEVIWVHGSKNVFSCLLNPNALSFYRSKMILDRPNCFGWHKYFWSGPNRFGRVQIILVRFKSDFPEQFFF